MSLGSLRLFSTVMSEKPAFYAIRIGRTVGIVRTWDACKKSVKNFNGAEFKKFETYREAVQFITSSPPEDLKTAANHSEKSKLLERKTTETLGLDATEKKLTTSNTYTDDDEYTVVYTDGSCLSNGQAGAVGGVGVFWGKDDPRNYSGSLGPGLQTCNRAEIRAIIKAIEQAHESGVHNLEIRTDSQFCIKAINSWLANWIANGWKLSRNKPVELEKEFKEFLVCRKDINLKLTYVKGHSANEGNVNADRLARTGSSQKIDGD